MNLKEAIKYLEALGMTITKEKLPANSHRKNPRIAYTIHWALPYCTMFTNPVLTVGQLKKVAEVIKSAIGKRTIL